jgi:hypothetical protein
LEQALQGVEAEFCRVPGASAVSRDILSRISQLVTAARLAHGGGWRPGGSSGRPSGDRSDLYRDVEAVRNQMRSFAYGLQHYTHRGPAYDRFARDVGSLLTQIDALSLMVRRGQSRSSLRTTMGSILTQADTISRSGGQVDLNIQRGWWAMEQRLQAVAESLGIRHSWNHVGQPVVLGHPVWGQLGSQPRPETGLAGRNREVVDLADQVLAKTGEAMQTLTPLAGRSRDVARLQSSLQDLQHEVQLLRHASASGRYGSSLTEAANRVTEQYKDTSGQFAVAVGRDATLNTPLFYQIGELVQRLRYAAAGIST